MIDCYAGWGYVTFDALVANDAFLAAEPDLVSRAAEYLARANSDYTTDSDKPEWLVDGNYTAAVSSCLFPWLRAIGENLRCQKYERLSFSYIFMF